MKKTINGITYDTDTAEQLLYMDNGLPNTDSAHVAVCIYTTEDGHKFVRLGNGSDLAPVSDAEYERIAELWNGDAADCDFALRAASAIATGEWQYGGWDDAFDYVEGMRDPTPRMGRPRKLARPRKYYAVLLDPKLMRRAEVLAMERKVSNSGYSRSDLINAALAEYLDRHSE